MSEITVFVKILAWVFGIWSLKIIVLRKLGAWLYTDLDELKDRLHGIERTFPVLRPLVVLVVCIAAIITLW